MRMFTATVVAATAGSAFAGLSTTDPGLFTDIDDRFEARIRLDAGNSQTWKSAIWDDTTLLGTSGNVQNLFTNGAVNPFSFSYDAVTGDASLTVAGRTVTETISLTPGSGIAGFRFFVRGEANAATTTVANLMASVDGAAAESVPGLATTLSTGFVESPNYYVDSLSVASLALTGDVTFDWLGTATQNNLKNERLKFSFKVLEGTPIPSPAGVAMLAFGGLVALRRRR